MLVAAPAASQQIVLQQPVDCDLGQTCFIQQYVDHDSSPDARDHTCGPLSYDGHKGTDFALPSLDAMARGVDVLAAAPGVVRGVRDGMPDIASNDANAEGLDGRDCGNGVVLDHANGWETQYCHMKLNSISVASGDQVTPETVLGEIGLSGRTMFPHLHLSVRRSGDVVDPFAPKAVQDCTQDQGQQLFTPAIDYSPGGLIASGFSDGVPDYSAIKAGTAASANMSADAPALVIWGYAFGAQAGDILRMRIDGPDEEVMSEDQMIEAAKAQLFHAIGRRTPAGGWPAGDYSGRIELIRDGQSIDTEDTMVRLR